MSRHLITAAFGATLAVAMPTLTTAAPSFMHAALVISTGVGADRVAGSGKQANEVRPVSDFHALRLAGPIDVEVHAATRESLTVQADDNLLPYIETQVRNGALEIGLHKGVSFYTRNPIKVIVECKTLNSIAASGSGDIHVDRAQARDFDVVISGSNDVTIEALEADILAVSISGSGDFRAAGKAPTQGISIAGSGDVDTANLVGEQVAVKIAGSGDAKVHASRTLSVSIAGSGDVRYRGQPQISRAIAGSGEVSALP